VALCPLVTVALFGVNDSEKFNGAIKFSVNAIVLADGRF
jgi:hypothetical protein